jgi:hypothetical protein
MTIILRFHGELIEKNDTDGEREHHNIDDGEKKYV